jgi:hypothetical protein
MQRRETENSSRVLVLVVFVAAPATRAGLHLPKPTCERRRDRLLHGASGASEGLDAQLLEQGDSPPTHTPSHDHLSLVAAHERRHGSWLMIPVVGIGHNRHRLNPLVAYIHKGEVGTSAEVMSNPTI